MPGDTKKKKTQNSSVDGKRRRRIVHLHSRGEADTWDRGKEVPGEGARTGGRTKLYLILLGRRLETARKEQFLAMGGVVEGC